METSSVGSIRRWEEVAPVERRSGALIGSVPTSRGVVPVYSLGALLGLAVPCNPAGPVFVVSSRDHMYGVQVDRVARAVSVEVTEPRQLPAVAADPIGRIRGVVRLDGDISLVLSPVRLAPRNAAGEPEQAEAPFAAPGHWAANPPPQNHKKLLCFTEPSGDSSTLFAFTLRQMIEVVQGLRVFRLGDYVPRLHGLIDWRGHIVPVVEPQALLGAAGQRAFPSDAKFAILRGSRSRDLFAMPAHNFAALSLPLGKGLAVGDAVNDLGPYLRAGFSIAGGRMVLPDLDRLAAAR